MEVDCNRTAWKSSNESLHGAANISTHKAEYEDFYLRAQFITGLICYPIFCFFGLTGNILSIIVLGQRKMATSTNVYLLGLAVADSIKLINDAFYVLVTFLLHTNPVEGNRALGYLYPYAHYIMNMSVCVTAWITVSVAAERYIMVCHATRARALCSISRARVITISVFISMGILTIPLGLRYRTVTVFQNRTNRSVVEVERTELWNDPTFVTAYTWVQNLLRSIIPLLLLCTLNYFIVQALRRTRANRRRMSSRQRITVMLLSVIIVFMICVTPDAIMSTVFGFGYYDANYLARGIREITDMLLTVNSAVNFVLYCTFNKVFRRHFILLFCGRCYEGRMVPDDMHARRSSMTTFKAPVMNGNRHGGADECQATLV